MDFYNRASVALNEASSDRSGVAGPTPLSRLYRHKDECLIRDQVLEGRSA